MKHGFIKIPSAISENVCKSLAYFALLFPMSNDSSKAAFVQVPLILLASSLIVSAAELKIVDDFRRSFGMSVPNTSPAPAVVI